MRKWLYLALGASLALGFSEATFAQVKLIADKNPSIAATPAPVPSDQLMVDCRKYFGNQRFKVTVAANLFYSQTHERFYNFGTTSETAPKFVSGDCVLGYNWNDHKGAFRWMEGKFNGSKLIVGDRRWEWTEFTPLPDGRLFQQGTYQSGSSYVRHEDRYLVPINR